MVISMERLRSIRTLAGAGFALVALACGSSSSNGGTVQQACKSDLDCKHGQTCKSNICQGSTPCKSSADCLNGQECSSDLVCVPIGSAGGSTGTGGLSGGGESTGSGGIIGGGGTGGSCVGDTVACSVNGDCCGYPSSSHCVNFGTSATCAHLCTSATDCPTGCCVGLTTNGTSNGLKACGPSSACATGSGGAPPGTGGTSSTGGCVGDLGSCTVNGDCCGYPNSNRCWDPGTGAVCAIVCTSGAECVSGCCLLLNSGYSVCAPGSFCP